MEKSAAIEQKYKNINYYSNEQELPVPFQVEYKIIVNAIEELEVLYNNKDKIGCFGNGYYYSSTLKANENSLLAPVTILFADGFKSLSQYYEQTAFHVRAFRSIRN